MAVPNKFHRSAQKFFTKRYSKKSEVREKLTLKIEVKGLTPSKSIERLKLLLQPQVISFCRKQEPTASVERTIQKASFPEILSFQSERKKKFAKSPDCEKKSVPKSIFVNSAIKPNIVKPVENFVKPVLSPYDLWKSQNNIKGKVFVLAGNYPDVREALLQRGWVENEDAESIYFDLKWSRNARVPTNLLDWQFYNHFPRNFELSVKWQLYENLRKIDKSSFYYLHFLPRSFKLDTKGQEEFFENFKSLYSISLLKCYAENPSAYPVEKIIVAQIVCRRFITEIEKENYKNNRLSSLVMNVEWKILTSSDINEIRASYSRLMLGSSIETANSTASLLKELQEKDPQFHISGKKNIWIIKAGRKSRGRDISLFTDYDSLKDLMGSSACWVVQKYIENPLIICNKKFDIRQWVLVSSSDPLTIWIYKQCYLRFSIDDYTDEVLSNPFIHLTNNSISKKSSKFESANIEGCMWTKQQFQDYLLQATGNDLWALSIFPTIKKIVKSTLTTIGNLGRTNSFELFGYDFMIDDKMKPWLLEVNSSPAMDYSTTVTEVLVKEVLEDAVKVIVDWPSGGTDTGGFELCYKYRIGF